MTLPRALPTIALVTLACASEPSEGTSSTADTLTSATTAASGGDGDASSEGDGEDDASTGDGDSSSTSTTGDGDGDGDGDGFSCPPGLEGQTPELEGLSFALVATPPDDGYPETGTFEILEGPVWTGGKLYLSHIAGGGPPPKARILTLDGATLQPFAADVGTNGLAVDAAGNLVVARHLDGSIARLALADPQTLTPWVDGYQGERFNSPNDLVISSAGHLYFSDPNWQAPNPNPQADERAYFVLDGGEVTPFADEVDKPNGVMISLDESRIYVGGTNGLFAYALDSSGAPVGPGSAIAGVNGGVDGMGKDCAGNLYVTANGQVVVLSPDDQVLGSVPLSGVTNIAFGGPERTTLYATTLENPGVHALELDIPGFPY